MTKIKYDASLMKIISVFETMTGAKLKDCFENKNQQLVFIVEPGQIGMAIGKNAVNVRRLETMLKKRIKIIEFNDNVLDFIRNLIYPLRPVDISENNDGIAIAGGDMKTKGLLIGRNFQNLEETKSIVNRYFKIADIKVV